MARRSEHSQEEIKEMVLKAAETIVVEEGFDKLKVRKIALEIGYTVGSIYMVFDNMADLIMHIKGRTLDDITEQLNAVVMADSAEQTISRLANVYLTFAYQNFNRWRMIFDHQLAVNEAVPSWYQQKVDKIFALIERHFEQLSKNHNKQQSAQAAYALWSGVHGVCTLSLTGKLDLLDVADVEKMVDLLVDNFILGWKQN